MRETASKNPHTTRGPTYAQEQINKRAQIPRIIRTTNTSTYPQDKRIMRGDISHPPSVADKHCKEATVSRTIERPTGPDRLGITSRSLGASNNRGHCSSDSDEDGPTKRCRRTKGAEQTRPRQSKIKQEMQQARLRRPKRPKRRKSPKNRTRNAVVNPSGSFEGTYQMFVLVHPFFRGTLLGLPCFHVNFDSMPFLRPRYWHCVAVAVSTR